MRSYPSCWKNVLSQLGFKRKRRKASKQHDYLRRRSLFEVLEARQMLSADPVFEFDSEEIVVAAAIESRTPVTISSKPEFHLIQPEIPQEELDAIPKELRQEIEPVFQVETVTTVTGPKAILSFNPAYTATPPSALQELRLELRQDGRVLETFDVLIDIAEQEFRDRFLTDRLQAIATDIPEIDRIDEGPVPPNAEVAAEVEYVRNLYGPLTLEQSEIYEIYVLGAETTIKQPTEAAPADLPAWSKLQAETRGVLADDADREQFYTLVYEESQSTKIDRTQATTKAEQEAVAQREKSLQDMALLLARDLERDLESEKPSLALTASQVRDELVAVSNPRDILFAGLKVDQEVERKAFANGDEKAVSFIETGHYVFSDALEIDLGQHQAMVQVTRSSNQRIAPLVSVSESPAVEDGSLDEANPSINGGTATSLNVDGSTGAIEEALVRFHLHELTDFNDPTTIAAATLELTEIGTGVGDAEIYVWNGLLAGPTDSVTDWNETNLDWNHVDGDLQLESNLSEFTKLSDWTAGTTTDVDVTESVQRALLYGDADGDGEFSGLGDIEAFHLAVTNWDAYVAEYGPRASSANDLLNRLDSGLGNGTIDTADIADFFRRHGYSQGDYNLDGTVQDNEDSGPDGLDWAVFNANYGVENARFSQGDGDFDGVVDMDDYNLWYNAKSEDNVSAEEPEIVLWVRPQDETTDIEFAAQEHATLDGPTLSIETQPDLALNKFSVDGSNLVVDYAVFGEDFSNVKVQLYQVGDPDTLLHETGVLTGTQGSHQTLIATSVLSAIVEGDSIYAKVVGTPAAGTQSNTDNDTLDFEFSTDAIQTVNSVDDAGMDTLLGTKHTLRELLDANESLGWFDTLKFDDPTLFATGPRTITLGDHDADHVADRIDLDQNIAIEGPGVDLLTIDARDQTQGFYVLAGADVELSGLTITGGYSSNHGGAIYTRGALTLDSVAVLDSEAVLNAGGIFVYSTGTLDLIRSTVDGNQASAGGGISANYLPIGPSLTIDSSTVSNNTSTGGSGGLNVLGTSGATPTEVYIVNSTFSGNDAATSVGAIRTQTNTELTIVNSTITDNSAQSQAGGIYSHNGTTTYLHNTIIADNHTNSYATWSDALAITPFDASSSNNLIGIRHYSIGITDGTNGNQIGSSATPLDPMLAPLDDYGGPTLAHALQAASTAIDQGSDTIAVAYGISVDQLDISQNYDVPNIGIVGTATDIGSYSRMVKHAAITQVINSTVALAVRSPDEKLSASRDSGPLTWRDALDLSKRLENSDSTISFDAETFHSPLTIYLGDENGNGLIDGDEIPKPLPIKSNVTIIGPGADLLEISARHPGSNLVAEHVLDIRSLSATLTGISITGASSSGISTTGDLTLDGVEIHNNEGMGLSGSGTVDIRNSTIAENQGIGVRIAGLGNHTLTNTTISGNQGTGLVAEVGDVTVTNTTITNNHSADNAGGILVTTGGATPPATVTLHNTIVANNSAAGSQVELVEENGGTINSTSSYNLIGHIGSAAGLESDPTNIVGTGPQGITEPRLDPLGYYGGPTRTHALLSDSPALDAGHDLIANSNGILDQRGFDRTYDHPSSGSGSFTADMGAFELQVAHWIEAENYSAIDTGSRSTDPANSDDFIKLEVIGDPSASKGRLVSIFPGQDRGHAADPTGNEFFTEYPLEIETDGLHSIWIRAILPADESNEDPPGGQANATELVIKVFDDDGGPPVTSQSLTNFTSNNWTWFKIPNNINFQQGSHTLQIIHREKSMQLDKILITDDTNFQPSGLEGDDPKFHSLDTIALEATVRDFNADGWNPGASSTVSPHPDFQNSALDHQAEYASTGLASQQLHVETGKPTIANYFFAEGQEPSKQRIDTGLNAAEQFNYWFTDKEDMPFSSSVTTTAHFIEDVYTEGLYHFTGATTPGAPAASTHEFYPIDGLLFSNQDSPDYELNPLSDANDINREYDAIRERHNAFFTMELHADFTYEGPDQFLDIVESDDDLWIYINNDLWIDNGGVHSSIGVENKTLSEVSGLTAGVTYSFDLFYAQRYTFDAHLAFETNIELRPPGTEVLLTEGDKLVEEHKYPITINGNMDGAIQIDYSNLEFDDEADQDINDAFELALIDSKGRAMVPTLGTGRDAFISIVENGSSSQTYIAPGVLHDSDNTTVTVDISSLVAEAAQNGPIDNLELVARLVNNDSDNDTTVRLASGVTFVESPAVLDDSVGPFVNLGSQVSESIDLEQLDDVTSKFFIDYTHTSYDEDTNVLKTGLNLIVAQEDTYIRGPLVAVVNNIRWQELDETAPLDVVALNETGTTATGARYYDLTDLAFTTNEFLKFDEADVSGLDLEFLARDKNKRFDYDLTILGHLNDAPYFTNTPVYTDPPAPIVEIPQGNVFRHTALGADPDKDEITFDLIEAPVGLQFTNPIPGNNSLDGKMTWDTSGQTVGSSHWVRMVVKDPFEAQSELQEFAIKIVAPSENLPPYFIEPGPGVDAYVGQVYRFDASAIDPDHDYPLTFSRIEHVTHDRLMQDDVSFDADTGELIWTPIHSDIDKTYNVVIQVSDDDGALAEQPLSFSITVHQGDAAQTGDVDLTIYDVILPEDLDSFDRQTLTVSGTVTAKIANSGPGDVIGPFDVMFFEDRNLDQVYTPGEDAVLGTTRVERPVPAGTMDIDVAAVLDGQVAFAGAPIWAFVDSGQGIGESDEDNNYSGSHEFCVPDSDPIQFSPIVERTLPIIDYDFANTHTRMTPLVIQIDDDSVPEIIYVDNEGYIYIFNGKTGNPLFNVSEELHTGIVARAPANGEHDIAAGDIDGDGEIEIAFVEAGVGGAGDRLAVLHFATNNLGVTSIEETWYQTAANGTSNVISPMGTISIANVDVDAEAEIIVGPRVFDLDIVMGQIIEKAIDFSATEDVNADFLDDAIDSVVADLNGDGYGDIIAGRTAYTAINVSEGEDNFLWQNEDITVHSIGGVFGSAAVADFHAGGIRENMDGLPEVVVVSDNIVYILDGSTGDTIWEKELIDSPRLNPPEHRSTYNGGPPIVADLNGDGYLEIGIGESLQYEVFEVNFDQPLSERVWRAGINTNLSFNGASVFDFENDGHPEIVYSDDENLWFFSLPTNSQSLSLDTTSLTLPGIPSVFSSPVIADVDDDDHAEIVFGASELSGPDNAQLSSGVNIIGYDLETLNPGEIELIPLARNIWNQESYHVTNINDDGSIPIFEQPSWLEGNNYRTQVSTENCVLLPDLIPSYLREQTSSDGTYFTARVGNAGALPTPLDVDVTVSFYDGTPNTGTLLGETNVSLNQLTTGQYEDVSIHYTGSPVEFEEITVFVDSLDLIDEGDRENNNTYSFSTGLIFNHDPEITSVPSGQVHSGDTFTGFATATDDNEEQTLLYDLRNGPEGMTIHPTDGLITWAPVTTHLDPRFYSATVEVRDGHGGFDSKPFSIEVIPENIAPVFVDEARLPDAVAGAEYEVTLLAYDPFDPGTGDKFLEIDWETVTYNGLTLTGVSDDGYAATFSGSAITAGTDQAVDFTVTSSADSSDTATKTFLINVLPSSTQNSPPEITNAPRTKTGVLQPFAYRVEVSDPDNNPLEVVVTAKEKISGDDVTVFDPDSAPNAAALVFDPKTRLLTWRPGFDDLIEGPYEFTVTADDNTADQITPETKTFDVYVTGQPAAPSLGGFPNLLLPKQDNKAPVILDQSYDFAEVDEEYNISFEAISPDRNALFWSMPNQKNLRMAFDPRTAELTWTPTVDDLGKHVISVRVVDSLGGVDEHDFEIEVRSDVASPGGIVSLPPRLGSLSENAFTLERGRTFELDVAATSQHEGPLFFSLDEAAPSDMFVRRLSDTTAQVVWVTDVATELSTTAGDYQATVKVKDQYGVESLAGQLFSISIEQNDQDKPVVSLIPEQPSALPEMRVNFLLGITEHTGLCDIRLTALPEGAAESERFAISVFSDLTARHSFDTPGTYILTATATDEAGLEGTETIEFVVANPLEVVLPTVDITNSFNSFPDDPTVIKTSEEIEFSINRQSQLETSYRLELVNPTSGRSVKVLAEGSLPSTGPNQFDFDEVFINPLTIPNGTYILQLSAENEFGIPVYDRESLEIDTGDSKLGNFNLDFVDLEASVIGLPVIIQRSYDTTNADEHRDFGYGWNLEMATVELTTEIPLDTVDEFDINSGFGHGSRINVTLPDGTVAGFRVEAEAIEGIGGAFVSGFADFVELVITPDDPAGPQLFLESYPGQVRITDSGRFSVGLAGDGSPFHPALDHSRNNYRLETPDGLIFDIDGKTQKQTRVSDRDGNTLQFTPAGGVIARNVSGEIITEITIVRDTLHDNRISKIIDPEGQEILYGYDPSTGDLTSVTNRAGEPTSFEYDFPATLREHFLTTIVDPRGVPVLEAQFDIDSGRLSGLLDAAGNLAEFNYELDAEEFTNNPALENHTIERVFDASDDPLVNGGEGVPTEILRNANGDVVRRITLLGDDVESSDPNDVLWQVVVFEYDPTASEGESANQIGQSKPFTVKVAEPVDHNQYVDLPDGYFSASAAIASDDPADSRVWESLRQFDSENNVILSMDGLGNMTSFADYDQFGNPGIIIDPLGNVTTNNFIDGQLKESEDAEGNITKYGYDANGNLDRLTQVNRDSGDDVVTTFLFDSAGNLLQSMGPDGQVRHFVYDDRSNQTLSYQHWTNPNNASDEKTLATRTDYDEEDRVVGTSQYTLDSRVENLTISQLPAAEWSTSSQYNDAGQADKTTDRFDKSTYTLYNKQGNVVETRTEAVNELGAPVWIVSRTYYDANGRAAATSGSLVVANPLDPLNENFDPEDDSYVTADVRISYTTYDALGRIKETRQLAGVDLEMIDTDPADPDREFSERVFDTSFVLPAGAALAAATLSRNTTEYDEQGRVYKTESFYTVDDNGPTEKELTTTYFKYDDAGRQTNVYQVFDVNNDGNSTGFTLVGDFPDPQGTDVIHTQTSYDKAGRQETTTDAEGTVTRFEYDKLGRVAKTVADEGGLHVITETKYDSLGRREAEIGPYSLTNPPAEFTEVTTRYEYDEVGSLERVILPEVTNPLNIADTLTGVATYEYEYDDYGNQELIRDPMDDKFGYSDDKETTFTYDHRSRQLSRTLPDGLIERMFYDDEPNSLANGVGLGQLAYSVDFEGNVTEYRYDNTASGGGRLVEKLYYKQLGLSLTTATTLSQIRALLNPHSPTSTVSYQYDALGRQTQIVDSTGATNNKYDKDGRLEQIESPQGVINYRYDNLGRLTRTFTSPNVTATSEITDTSYEYDQLGRLKTVTAVERNSSLTNEAPTKYSYDKNGNLDEVEIPNGVISDYIYDKLNRLDDLVHYDETGGGEGYQEGSDDLLARFDYTVRADGRRVRVVETDDQNNETTIDWIYDELGRLVEESYDFDHFTNNNLDYDYIARYGFDLASNRVRYEFDDVDNATNDKTVTYVYDENDRLKSETSNDRHTVYGYDATTQRTKTEHSGQNAQGTIQKITTYTYNSKGRLEKVEIDEEGAGPVESTTTYEYNDDGIRVSQTNVDDNETTIYHIDPNNHTGYAQVLEEGVDSGAANGKLEASEVDATYTLGHDIIAQTIDENTTGLPSGASPGDVVYFLYDGHGSTRAFTDVGAAVLERYAYDAYGNMLTGALLAATTDLTRFLYSGEQTDKSGLQYLRARYYNPGNGRLNRLDPFAGNISDPQSLHKYLYGHGDPISNIDPSGQFLGSILSIGVAGYSRGLHTVAAAQALKTVGTAVGALSAGSALGIAANTWLGGTVADGAIYGSQLGFGLFLAHTQRKLTQALLGGFFEALSSVVQNAYFLDNALNFTGFDRFIGLNRNTNFSRLSFGNKARSLALDAFNGFSTGVFQTAREGFTGNGSIDLSVYDTMFTSLLSDLFKSPPLSWSQIAANSFSAGGASLVRELVLKNPDLDTLVKQIGVDVFYSVMIEFGLLSLDAVTPIIGPLTGDQSRFQ